MAFCFKCGTNLPDGSVFCSSCGASQGVAQLPEQPVQQAQSAQQQIPQQPAPESYQQPYQAPEPYQQPYQAPQYQQPQYQAPQYQQPQYQQPYQAPQYQQPQYQAPAQPQYQQPYYQPQPGSAVAQAIKGGSSILKWLIPLLAVAAVAVIVIIIVTGGGVGKSDEQLIRDRIQAFEDAYNNGDYEALLECMDSQMQAMMEASMGLMDGLMGELGGMDIGMSDMFGLAGMMGDFCTIEIQSIEIDGDTATVVVTMSIEMYGMSESQEAPLPMVKEDGDWYIGGVDNMIGSDYMDFFS